MAILISFLANENRYAAGFLIQQLWTRGTHQKTDRLFVGKVMKMYVLLGLKRLLLFVFDADNYCLLWLAIRNKFRKGVTASSDPATPSKKHAKAVNAG